MISLVKYAGGKGFLLDDIFKMFNELDVSTVLEVFGGSAKFLLNVREFTLDGRRFLVYNDRDRRLSNLFTVVRDNPDALVRKFEYAITSRVWFDEFKDDTGDPITDAFRELYILLVCDFDSGTYHSSRGNDKVPNFDVIIRRIREVHKVVRNWIIECLNYVDFIKRWDREDAFLYLDPPYLDNAYYRYNFSESDFRLLYNVLRNVKGRYIMNVGASDTIRRIFGEPSMVKEYRNVTVTDHDSYRDEWFYTNVK